MACVCVGLCVLCKALDGAMRSLGHPDRPRCPVSSKGKGGDPGAWWRYLSARAAGLRTSTPARVALDLRLALSDQTHLPGLRAQGGGSKETLTVAQVPTTKATMRLSFY